MQLLSTNISAPSCQDVGFSDERRRSYRSAPFAGWVFLPMVRRECKDKDKTEGPISSRAAQGLLGITIGIHHSLLTGGKFLCL